MVTAHTSWIYREVNTMNQLNFVCLHGFDPLHILRATKKQKQKQKKGGKSPIYNPSLQDCYKLKFNI